MFGTYFYNESMRRMTIGFGQIFNNIQIKRKDSNITITIFSMNMNIIKDSTKGNNNLS